MNDRALLSARVEECNSHSLRLDHEPHQEGQPVGNFPSSGVGMSDSEREAAARRAAIAMDAWYSQFKLTGDLICLEIAHRHMGQMVAILKGAKA